MNARYEPTRRSTRFAAALAAILTVVVLFDAVASLGDTEPSSANVRGISVGTVHIARAASGTEITVSQ